MYVFQKKNDDYEDDVFQLPEVSETDVNNLISLMPQGQLQYINGVTSLNLDATLYTSSFKKVTKACKEHKLVI